MYNYSGRSELIGAMRPLLKAARRPLGPEWKPYGLDPNGWHQLDLLVQRLVRDVYFEYLDRQKIRDALQKAVLRYRSANPRPKGNEFAAEILDALAQEPLRKTVYLGVEHLQLPHGTVVGNVRFVDPSSEPELLESLSNIGAAPSLLCEVKVTAGTADLLRDRAYDTAATALGLVRQQHLFGFSAKIYLSQVLYRLDDTWTWRDGSDIAQAGWWREKPHPIPMDLAHPNGKQWRAKLAELSDLYSVLQPGLKSRVSTCIDWLDVAALSNRWRIIIPAIFSGMEALLVPEMVGLKAALVTVRSVAIHAALDHGFFNPREIMEAYRLRSDLIHGTPTLEFLEGDATDFAEFCRLWAFRVLCDYLDLVQMTGAEDIRDIVSYLDGGKCNDVCAWLKEHGGSNIVAEYRDTVPMR